MRVMVIYGGDSEEREVSLRSGARIAEALTRRGHLVIPYDHKGGALPIEALQCAAGADALFLALHGGDGENGCLQARLTSCGLFHYTGSCPGGSAMAMAKDVAKQLVQHAKVPVARGRVLKSNREKAPFSFPCVLKPRSGGSSIGFEVLQNDLEWEKHPSLQGLLCEEYLPGREFTVGILDGKALPVVEIRARNGRYGYWQKYTPGAAEELCPAPISDAYVRRLHVFAQRAFQALGLRDYARIDFREGRDGIPRFLEANTLPGMTETSLFPLAAEKSGIPFAELCEKMAVMAAKRNIKRG